MNCGSTKYGTIRMASFDLNIILSYLSKCFKNSLGILAAHHI